MKKLLGKTIAFLLLFGSTVVWYYSLNPIDSEKNKKNDFLLALEEKEERLKTLNCNRILFVGGSGAAFGLDAEAVGKKTGRCGFNLGVHAGLGISFMVNQVSSLAKPGDIVVVSTEYYLSDAEIALKASVLQSMPQMEAYFQTTYAEKIEMHFEVFSKWFFDRARRIQATFFNGKEEVLKLDNNEFYRKGGFSAFGDYTQHLGKERPWGLFTTYEFEKRDYQEEIKVLNRLKSMEARGVKVFYVFPGYVDTDFESQKVALKYFESQMRAGLKFPVLGRPEDFLYPNAYFFDTAYHLGKEGREKRAATIAQLLQPYL